MQQNWFTTALIAVLAGALGAVGFGVAGAQNDDGASTEGVTINVDQPGAAAGGSIDGVALVCPGAGGAGGAGQGGGGAVAASANTNTLANGVVVENENVNVNEPVQEQVVITVPVFDDGAAGATAPIETPEAPETPDTPDTTDPSAGTESTPEDAPTNK